MVGGRRVSGFRLLVPGAAVMALLAALAGPASATPAVQATPTLSTTANPTGTIPLPGTFPLALTDSAVLSGGYLPTGFLSFTVFAPDGQIAAASFPVPVTGNGTYSKTLFVVPIGAS